MVFPVNLLQAAPPHPGHAVSTVICMAECADLFVKIATIQKSPNTRKWTFHFTRGSHTASDCKLFWSSESLFHLLRGSLAKILVYFPQKRLQTVPHSAGKLTLAFYLSFAFFRCESKSQAFLANPDGALRAWATGKQGVAWQGSACPRSDAAPPAPPALPPIAPCPMGTESLAITKVMPEKRMPVFTPGGDAAGSEMRRVQRTGLGCRQ